MVLAAPTRTHRLATVIYTPFARIAGSLSTDQWRLSDTLNGLSSEAFALQDATVAIPGQPLNPLGHPEVVVRRDDVVLCEHGNDDEALEHASEWEASQRDRVVVRCAVLAAGFAIVGNAHVSPGRTLVEHYLDGTAEFIPLTSASITSSQVTKSVECLLVNRRWISAMYALDETAASQAAPAAANSPAAMAASVLPPPSLEVAELDTATVAATLSGLPIFVGTHRASLASACTDLSRDGHIKRYDMPVGAYVFHEGDATDGVVIVEVGHLTGSSFTDPDAKKSYRSGAFLGGIKSMGTALLPMSVWAEAPSVIVLLREPAVLHLARSFPDAIGEIMHFLAPSKIPLPLPTPALGDVRPSGALRDRILRPPVKILRSALGIQRPGNLVPVHSAGSSECARVPLTLLRALPPGRIGDVVTLELGEDAVLLIHGETDDGQRSAWQTELPFRSITDVEVRTPRQVLAEHELSGLANAASSDVLIVTVSSGGEAPETGARLLGPKDALRTIARELTAKTGLDRSDTLWR